MYFYFKYDPVLEVIKTEANEHKLFVIWYNDYSKNGCYRTFYVITEL